MRFQYTSDDTTRFDSFSELLKYQTDRGLGLYDCTILDTITDLVWTANLSPTGTRYVNAASRKGWRLPRLAELVDLWDYDSAAIVDFGGVGGHLSPEVWTADARHGKRYSVFNMATGDIRPCHINALRRALWIKCP